MIRIGKLKVIGLKKEKQKKETYVSFYMARQSWTGLLSDFSLDGSPTF